MIDDVHACAAMKYLRNKPVKDLGEADFLHLVQAEGEGLLEMKISIDLEQSGHDSRRGTLQSYFEEIRQLFYRVRDVCMHVFLHMYMYLSMCMCIHLHEDTCTCSL